MIRTCRSRASVRTYWEWAALMDCRPLSVVTAPSTPIPQLGQAHDRIVDKRRPVRPAFVGVDLDQHEPGVVIDSDGKLVIAQTVGGSIYPGPRRDRGSTNRHLRRSHQAS